ncbi:MAG: hypothetical protein WD270_10215 [Acetobacterales bacterium]
MSMVTKQEISTALFACWRLARRDASAMRFFDTSLPGVWRSFFAAAIAYPPFLLLKLLGHPATGEPVDPFRFFAIHSIAYVVGWTLFPLAMVLLTEVLDREDRLFRFLVAFNWSNVLQVALLTTVAVLAAGSVLPDPLGPLAMLAATIAVLWYEWYIATVSLHVDGSQAAVVVIADVILGIAIAGIATAMV